MKPQTKYVLFELSRPVDDDRDEAKWHMIHGNPARMSVNGKDYAPIDQFWTFGPETTKKLEAFLTEVVNYAEENAT